MDSNKVCVSRVLALVGHVVGKGWKKRAHSQGPQRKSLIIIVCQQGGR